MSQHVFQFLSWLPVWQHASTCWKQQQFKIQFLTHQKLIHNLFITVQIIWDSHIKKLIHNLFMTIQI